MCLNDSNYVTVHSLINTMTANGAKRLTKCRDDVSRQFFSITCRKRVTFFYHFLQKGCQKHTMRNVGVQLSFYVYIFATFGYLTTVNQYLTTFFSKNYVSLKSSPLDEAKKSIKPFTKQKCKKCERLTHFFKK